MNLEELKREAAKLPKKDQVVLHEFLGDFVDSGLSVEEEWDQEISRRIKEVEDGTVETIPWEVVRKRLWKKFDLPEHQHTEG